MFKKLVLIGLLSIVPIQNILATSAVPAVDDLALDTQFRSFLSKTKEQYNSEGYILEENPAALNTDQWFIDKMRNREINNLVLAIMYIPLGRDRIITYNNDFSNLMDGPSERPYLFLKNVNYCLPKTSHLEVLCFVKYK